jgi:2-polyprenyl-3-methyl-5-hydroxy-6-metoxy-1,4-benzoquinol methylase
MGNLRWRVAQSIEQWWWRRYLAKKDKQEYLSWKKEYWQGFLKKCALKVPGEKIILDAGCGPAGIFIILENNTVSALDPLIEKYEAQLQHFSKSGYPKINFLTQSIEALSLNEHFDIIYCINAINHVADIKKAYQLLFDALKKGGELVLSIDAHNYKFLKKIFQAIPGDVLHPHQYSLEEYSQFGIDLGMQLKSTTLIKEEGIFNYYALVFTK